MWLVAAHASSATGQLLQLFGVPCPFDLDLCGSAIDLMEIIGSEFEGNCSDVFVQAMQLRGTGDWHDPRLLGQQPRQCNLSRCRILLFCEPAKQINQALVCFPS